MYVSSSGVRPWRCLRRLLMMAGVAIAVPLAGCASRSAKAPSDWPGDPATRVAGYTAQSDAPVRRVEMEADGLESQRAPYVRGVEVPDDPTQPYSPNYGRTGINRDNDSAPVAVEAAYIPADLPVEFRRKLAVATAD